MTDDLPKPGVVPLPPYARLGVAALIERGDTFAVGGRDANWLLLHRTEPVDAWDPPGGRMEEGEDLTAAVLREVAEETGLAVRVAGPCYSLLTFYKGERLLVVSMACRPVVDPDQVRLEASGADGWRWVSTRQWEELAAGGRSSWNVRDVRRAARTAGALWEIEDE